MSTGVLMLIIAGIVGVGLFMDSGVKVAGNGKANSKLPMGPPKTVNRDDYLSNQYSVVFPQTTAWTDNNNVKYYTPIGAVQRSKERKWEFSIPGGTKAIVYADNDQPPALYHQ